MLGTFLDICHYFPNIKYVAINTIWGSKFVSGTSFYAFLILSPPAHNITKHTSAHLKILVRVFCQNKESKLSANIFHQKNILMKQNVILKVFLWHSQQQLQKLFSKDIEMKTRDVSHKYY